MEKVNTIIINTFFGAGDILFVQSIANRFVKQGYKVLWPVTSVYEPLAKHFPNVTMVDKSFVNIDYNRTDAYELNGCRVIPLRFADSICKVPYTSCMMSKYLLMGQDWQTWKDDCVIVRDMPAENRLIELLGLNDGEPYNLISEQFTTGGARNIFITPPNNGYKNVYMKFIEGYTLIDWVTVMQNAATIHAVASSNIYVFELFPPNAIVNLYIRRPQENNHDNYSYLLTKERYILHP